MMKVLTLFSRLAPYDFKSFRVPEGVIPVLRCRQVGPGRTKKGFNRMVMISGVLRGLAKVAMIASASFFGNMATADGKVVSPVRWQASWIGAGRESDGVAFEKSFFVATPVVRATLHIAGLGFYEACLNGRKIGDKVLDPSPTDYDKRVLYSTYPVEDLVRGTNVLRIVLGHGWYDMRCHADWAFDAALWRDRPKTIAQLEVEGIDGSRSTIITDGTWELIRSPIVFDCLREGEVVDGREIGWRKLGRTAVVVPAPRGRLEPSGELPGAKIQARIAPERMQRLSDGRWLVTFPETLSGWISLMVRGQKSGDVVSVRYDENLGLDGGPAVSSAADWAAAQKQGVRKIDCFVRKLGSAGAFPGEMAMQMDRYISGGRPVETFEPRFVYHGFRYVLVSGLRNELKPDDIRAVSVRTDFGETGVFDCSDKTLTELVRMARNSYKVNFTDGIPTDCPHREKLGWTGDAWIASETGLCYFDSASAYRKWYQDVLDTQREDGSICAIAPTSGWGYKSYPGPVFDAVLGMLPWNLWRFCGDREIVDVAYPPLMRYLAHEKSLEMSPGLVDNGLGDWNALVKAHMPEKTYVVSCLYLRLKEIAAEFASVKGLADDARLLRESAEMTRSALRSKYGKGNGVYANGGQTAQALAIEMELCTADERSAVASQLVASVERTDCHVDFGLVGAKFVYRALSDVGRSDLAYRMIVNPTEPSMTKWINKNGTLWEDWGDGFSKCHVMLSDFAAWAQQHLAGISPTEPGYRRIRIAPKAIRDLQWVKAETGTPYGKIKSNWQRCQGELCFQVEIPPECRAEVVLPDGYREWVGGGKHSFRLNEVGDVKSGGNPAAILSLNGE